MARLPTTEETLTMRPPSPMCGNAVWMQFSGPTVLTSNTCRTSPGLTSEILPDKPNPALLTSTSSDPNSPTALQTIASTEPLSETSVSTARAAPPEAEISRRKSSSLPTALEASTTEAPRAASSMAVASPMPLDAPVTTATLPLKVRCPEELEPFPKRLAPWEPRHQATGFRIRGAAHQIVHRPVSNREAHPFRETL